MDHAASLPFFRETLLFLALVGILIPLLQRFRINQVIGFLVVGVVAGPYGSGSLAAEYPVLSFLTFPRQQGVQVLAELGVIDRQRRIVVDAPRQADGHRDDGTPRPHRQVRRDGGHAVRRLRERAHRGLELHGARAQPLADTAEQRAEAAGEAILLAATFDRRQVREVLVRVDEEERVQQ